jgi:hypothetical protein
MELFEVVPGLLIGTKIVPPGIRHDGVDAIVDLETGSLPGLLASRQGAST